MLPFSIALCFVPFLKRFWWIILSQVEIIDDSAEAEIARAKEMDEVEAHAGQLKLDESVISNIAVVGTSNLIKYLTAVCVLQNSLQNLCQRFWTQVKKSTLSQNFHIIKRGMIILVPLDSSWWDLSNGAFQIF